MSLIEALMNDREARARVEDMLRQLNEEAKPYSSRFAELAERVERHLDEDLVVAWVAGRATGQKEVFRALFPNAQFSSSPDPSIGFNTGEWWKGL